MNAPTTPLTPEQVARTAIAGALYGIADTVRASTMPNDPVSMALGGITSDLHARAIALGFITRERVDYELQRCIDQHGGAAETWTTRGFLEMTTRLAMRIYSGSGEQIERNRIGPVRVTMRAGAEALDATVDCALVVVPIDGVHFQTMYLGDAGQVARMVGSAFTVARIAYGAPCQMAAIDYARQLREKQEEEASSHE